MVVAGYLSTAQVAEALGVGVSTVKRWVDEGILPAHKTVGGHRKLLVADVLRLVRAGEIPRVDVGLLTAQTPRSRTPSPESLCERLIVAVRHGDDQLVRSLLCRAVDMGMALEKLADEVVAPAMKRIGHEWETGRIDVYHEHRGTLLVAAALYDIKARIEAQAAKNRPAAVGGAGEGDFYQLPSLLAQMVLLDAGWDAINLGPNTPMASFAQAIDDLRPRLLWLSVSHLPDESRLRTEFAALYEKARAAGVAVAVGGNGLTPELRASIPYTTYGDGLAHLAAFARTLHPPRKPPKRGRPVGS